MFGDLFERLIQRRGKQSAHPLPPPLKPSEQRSGVRFSSNDVAVVEWIDGADEFRRESANVHDLSKHGIGLWMTSRLTTGWPALIAHRDDILRGVVRHCQNRNDRWLVGFQVVKEERRRADRYPHNYPTQVTWQDEGVGQREAGLIVDGNDEGVQLELPCPIPVNSSIRLEASGWRRLGIVRYCRALDKRYRIGIHFAGGAVAQDAGDAFSG